jgi:hypothetical protein
LTDPLGPRWTDGPFIGRKGEDEARALLRDAPAPPPLTDVAAHRVLRKLRASVSQRRPRRWVLRPAVVVALALVVAGAAAAAARALLLGSPEALVLAPPLSPGTNPALHHRRVVPGQPPPAGAVAVAPDGHSPVARPAAAWPHTRRRTRAAAARLASSAESSRGIGDRRPATGDRRPATGDRPPAPAPGDRPPAPVTDNRSPDPAPGDRPPADTTSLAEETRLFRAALARLRIAGDPHGALALLDGYAAAFPHGSYAAEASVARVDALLAAGRRADALAALRALSLAALPRRVELTVMRAELAAAAGDCAGARADFDGALAERLPPKLEERALYGRLQCRDRAGDRAGARADLDRLLARFPRGNLAQSARAALGDP